MNTDIPVIYTAVSDPVAAGLAKEDGAALATLQVPVMLWR